MIDFQTVTREFRSLVHRRREMVTFLGSVFAASGIFLHNALKGSLPPTLFTLKEYLFAFYAVLLMVPTLILALRMARLHSGMVLNGILYARLMQEQTFMRKGDPQRAARHNFFGVSFIQFVLMDLLAGFSATVLGVALGVDLALALILGLSVVVVWVVLYLRFHRQAVAFAFQKIASDTCGPVDQKDWRAHISSSLEDTNSDMLGGIAFVGLIMFSMFEKLSGLGDIKRGNAGGAYENVQTYGPLICTCVMLVTCVFGLVTYIRIRLAVGSFSLQLDPTDRPFRPLRLTDSLLGYMLLAFLFAVSLHLFMVLLCPPLEESRGVLLVIDGAAFLAAVLAHDLTLFLAGRATQRS
jgi:hypothetical protein